MKPTTLGLKHVALNVFDVDICARFYIDIFNMEVDWHPDPDNIYLTSGSDNLALHRVDQCERDKKSQRLDHIGFLVASEKTVDDFFLFAKDKQVTILKEPKTHRDGARSFYCADPENNVVQVIYIPEK